MTVHGIGPHLFLTFGASNQGFDHFPSISSPVMPFHVPQPCDYVVRGYEGRIHEGIGQLRRHPDSHAHAEQLPDRLALPRPGHAAPVTLAHANEPVDGAEITLVAVQRLSPHQAAAPRASCDPLGVLFGLSLPPGLDGTRTDRSVAPQAAWCHFLAAFSA